MGSRSYKIQEALLDIIRKHELAFETENQSGTVTRDETFSWERIHMVSSARIGYILANKRGVDPDLAVCACSLHDFGRIITGKQSGHAEAGYLPVKEFLRNFNLSSNMLYPKSSEDKVVQFGGDGAVQFEEADAEKLSNYETVYFTNDEIEAIASAVKNHSNKGDIGTLLEEIVKDADVLDMHMYGRALTRAEQRDRLVKVLDEKNVIISIELEHK